MLAMPLYLLEPKTLIQKMNTRLLINIEIRPDSEQTKAAYLVLKYAHETAKSFLTSFETVN